MSEQRVQSPNWGNIQTEAGRTTSDVMQLVWRMLDGLRRDIRIIQGDVADSSSTGPDHVVVSDGGDPALPIHDGDGNFIYIPYEV